MLSHLHHEKLFVQTAGEVVDVGSQWKSFDRSRQTLVLEIGLLENVVNRSKSILENRKKEFLNKRILKQRKNTRNEN
jgi:hypothetical protein